MAYKKSNPNGQATMANSEPVVIASDQSTVPVSAASLPLPSLAATSTKQSDGSQKTQVVDGSGNVIGATANALDVNIKSNASSGIISTSNSTTSNLANGAIFTGTADDVTTYSEIRVSVFSSHASATNGLSLQQSSDGTNWDIIDTYTIAATIGATFVVPRQARFFRVVYTNGATLTTSLRIQTILNRTGAATSSQRPSDAYTNETDLVQNQSFLMGYNGTTWDRIRTVGTGVLSASAVLTAGAATIGSIASIGTSVTPGTAAANLGKAEDAAHTTGDVGIAAWGVRNDNAATTFTSADGDYSPHAMDLKGRTIVRQVASTGTPSSVAAATTSTTLLAANSARMGATISNDSSAVLYIGLFGTTSTTSYTATLAGAASAPFSYYEVPAGYTGTITGVWASATGNARVTEIV